MGAEWRVWQGTENERNLRLGKGSERRKGKVIVYMSVGGKAKGRDGKEGKEGKGREIRVGGNEKSKLKRREMTKDESKEE